VWATPVHDLARDLVMAICEDVRFDDYRVSNNAFDRKPPTIDFWPNALNGDAASPVNPVFRHASEPPNGYPADSGLAVSRATGNSFSTSPTEIAIDPLPASSVASVVRAVKTSRHHSGDAGGNVMWVPLQNP
jgi:hypothetical protein